MRDNTVTRWLRALGVSLAILGVVGLLTVADDLRHRGELLVVGSVLVTGLVLMALSARRAS